MTKRSGRTVVYLFVHPLYVIHEVRQPTHYHGAIDVGKRAVVTALFLRGRQQRLPCLVRTIWRPQVSSVTQTWRHRNVNIICHCIEYVSTWQILYVRTIQINTFHCQSSLHPHSNYQISAANKKWTSRKATTSRTMTVIWFKVRVVKNTFFLRRVFLLF